MSDQSPNDTYINRVHALIEKAESTPYQAEADAFMAKAQELMGRHTIDDAMLAAAGHATDEIVQDHRVIAAPYASAKSFLLGAVAQANRCRVVTERSSGGRVYCTVVGYQTDVDNVRLLFMALSYQAVRFMLAATVPPHDTPRRFRHSFLLAYAHRIGERLREVEQATQAEAEREQLEQPTGRSVSLVLASREAKVDRALTDAYPNLRTKRVQSSSQSGHVSGRSAADRSSLNQQGIAGPQQGLPRG
ncbi:DUF2786 domain-containing protein [Aquihabitans sp. McL0605]|uniref:DUF2786 domain-containing protein n=1 Tax=Aquihabitans sp. McL0605 TaxID=3415671 RepID=UPI003CFA34F6